MGEVDDPKDCGKLFASCKEYYPDGSEGRWQLHRLVRACPPAVHKCMLRYFAAPPAVVGSNWMGFRGTCCMPDLVCSYEFPGGKLAGVNVNHIRDHSAPEGSVWKIASIVDLPYRGFIGDLDSEHDQRVGRNVGGVISVLRMTGAGLKSPAVQDGGLYIDCGGWVGISALATALKVSVAELIHQSLSLTTDPTHCCRCVDI